MRTIVRYNHKGLAKMIHCKLLRLGVYCLFCILQLKICHAENVNWELEETWSALSLAMCNKR